MLENFSYEKCFWKVLTYLDNLEEEIAVEDLAILLGVEKELIFRGVQFFERFNIEYKCEGLFGSVTFKTENPAPPLPYGTIKIEFHSLDCPADVGIFINTS